MKLSVCFKTTRSILFIEKSRKLEEKRIIFARLLIFSPNKLRRLWKKLSLKFSTHVESTLNRTVREKKKKKEKTASCPRWKSQTVRWQITSNYRRTDSLMHRLPSQYYSLFAGMSILPANTACEYSRSRNMFRVCDRAIWCTDYRVNSVPCS